MKKRLLSLVLGCCLLSGGCSSQKSSEAVKLDQDNPVGITVWHYYNGAQKTAFDQLTAEFNDTVGKEKGIYVEGHSKGDVTELEEAVMASSRKEVGSEVMPNIFSSYADTAYEIEKEGLLADLSLYFTEEELGEYVDSYIEEGRIGANGELKIFPVAKSTEVLMVNQTVWDEFAAAAGVSEEQFKTKKGIVELAEAYYNWTDEKTPDVPNDGKAFYGRDAMANLFIIGSMQMGVELFQVENQKVTLNVDRSVFKKIWDTYYIPYIKGYFGAYGRFRSDDVKIGQLIAYTGSVASASYFPDEVEIGDSITPIQCMVLPVPVFEDGQAYIVQQGAGMVITKGDEREEYASSLFLKWFTDAERNTQFGCSSGYIPVKKDANRKEVLDKVIEANGLTISDKEYTTLLTSYDMVNHNKMYTNRAFDGGTKARKILEYSLSDKAAADREQVKARLDAGLSLEDAVADYSSEEAFDAWFSDVKAQLEACVAEQ